jgi:hypothetical protein
MTMTTNTVVTSGGLTADERNSVSGDVSHESGLTGDELNSVSGGRVVRITNIRANATTLSGGSAAGATPVVA